MFGSLEAGELVFFDAASGRELLTWALPHRVTALRFSPDGRVLAVGTFDGKVHLFERAP
ncbi:MAG: hypothetical protein AAF628_33230 [Planctomycetota bacterium]